MNKKINRILFLLHLPPPVHGSSVVGSFIKESKSINTKFKCDYVNLLASQNMAESGIVNVNKLIGFVITWFKVLSLIIRKRPSLCYLALTTSGAAFYKDLLIVILLRIFRIKRIYHLHNKGISRNQHKVINRLCYRFVFTNAEIILLSKYLYADIQAFVPESKTHICPNGIPDQISNSESLIPIHNYTNPILKAAQNLSNNIRILFLSNLIESKGVYILLDACSLLKKKGIAFECIFIGGESDVSATNLNNRITMLGLNQQVTYKGRKLGSEKEFAFQNADIFAFPTYYPHECFPLVLLEAMSFSMPVVTTFEGGIQDIVEDGITGFLVTQKNAEALADKLEILIKNSQLRRQMSTSARRKYEQEFALEIFEHKLAYILQQAIEKK
jgi:glycosyltransferase involved in cell wall biosynthesis